MNSSEPSTPSNLHFKSEKDKKVLQVFQDFFDKENISAGAAFRKMQWLLLKLSRVTKCSWTAEAHVSLSGEINDRRYTGYINFTSAEQHEVVITFSIHNLKQFNHVSTQLRSGFLGNSYIQAPYREATMLFTFHDSLITYHTKLKEKVRSDNYTEYKAFYVTEYHKRPLWERLLRSVTMNSDEKSCIVLSAIPMEDTDAS